MVFIMYSLSNCIASHTQTDAVTHLFLFDMTKVGNFGDDTIAEH